jgi:hypothetical protein
MIREHPATYPSAVPLCPSAPLRFQPLPLLLFALSKVGLEAGNLAGLAAGCWLTMKVDALKV